MLNFSSHLYMVPSAPVPLLPAVQIPAHVHERAQNSHGTPRHPFWTQAFTKRTYATLQPIKCQTKPLIRPWKYRQGEERDGWQKGEVAVGRDGQLHKKGYSVPGSWKWKKMVKVDGWEMQKSERGSENKKKDRALKCLLRRERPRWGPGAWCCQPQQLDLTAGLFLIVLAAGLFWVFQCSGF